MKTLNEFVVNENQEGKSFKNVKAGDKIYGIKLPYIKNPKASLIEGTIKEIKIDTSDENEYYGSTELKFELNGKERTIMLWARELNNSMLTCGRSKFFLSQEDRDLYYKEKTADDIKSINKDFELIEKFKKETGEKEEKQKNGEFNSLEEEIEAIKDEYDHEYGSLKDNAEKDNEMKKKIEAAKKKWGNK